MWALDPEGARAADMTRKRQAHRRVLWLRMGASGRLRKSAVELANTWHSGLIAGTSTLLVRRVDGLNWAVLFNTEANPKGEALSGLIDGLVHEGGGRRATLAGTGPVNG